MSMRALLKTCFFIFFSTLLLSCTVYTEKQTEALSKTVYATKDSIDYARIDLADYYIGEATRIVKPPKKRIEILPIYQTPKPASTLKPNQDKQRVVIVPERYKNDYVVVVSSKEYDELLADKQINQQLKKDNDKLKQAKQMVDDELTKQAKYNNKMVEDLNKLQKQITEKDLALLRKNLIITILIASIGSGVYLRMKGIL